MHCAILLKPNANFLMSLLKLLLGNSGKKCHLSPISYDRYQKDLFAHIRCCNCIIPDCYNYTYKRRHLFWKPWSRQRWPWVPQIHNTQTPFFNNELDGLHGFTSINVKLDQSDKSVEKIQIRYSRASTQRRKLVSLLSSNPSSALPSRPRPLPPSVYPLVRVRAIELCSSRTVVVIKVKKAFAAVVFWVCRVCLGPSKEV